MPVNTPVPGVMVPGAIGLLLHVPPDGVQFNVVEDPAQTTSVPVMRPGDGLTKTLALAVQPVDSV